MADSTNYVINYIGDLNDIFTKVKELTRINTLAAQKMGTDFTAAVNLIDQQISKISQKTIKVPQLDASGKATGGTIDQLTDTRQVTSIIETADGKFKKFVETQVRVDGAFKSLNTTISAYKNLTKEAASSEQVFLGTLSQVLPALTSTDRINKELARSFGAAAQGATILGTQLSAAGVKTRQLVVDGQKLTQETRNFETTVKLANGTTKTLSDTVTTVGGNVKSVSSSFVTGATTAKSFGENLAFILQRAALTIPVWFALRSSLSTVFTTVKNGLSDLVAFDLALQKVRRNLAGTPQEIEANFKTARTEITKFSLESGKSTEEISEAIKKFASIGFSFQDSLQGGIEATKLSVLLFGDAADTANAFARSIKVLADESKGAASIQEQMAETFALTAELEKTNQFELDEVTQSLIKFAPTAKSAGLSLRETLVLLATLGTAGRTGSNAGTLLSSTVNELRGNLDKLAASLGVSVNPKLDSTFVVMGKVLDKAEALGKTDSLGAAQAKALTEVFGGEKGTKTVASLVALNQQFKENAKIVPDITKFNKEFEQVNDTLSSNVRKLNNELKENGKAFVAALLGAEDFNASVKKLNSGVASTKPAIEGVGDAIRNTFANGVNIASIIGFTALMGNVLKVGIGGAISGLGATLTRGGAFIASRLGIGAIGGIPGLVAAVGSIGVVATNTILDGIDRNKDRARQASADLAAKALEGIQGKLSKFELKNLILGIASGGLKLDPSLNTKNILARLQAQFTKTVTIEADVAFKAKSLDFLTTGETDKLSKLVIKNQLDIARSQGASTSELLQQEGLLNKQFHIYEDEFSVIDRQLQIQRALTEEKRLQNKLGSDSVKLFDIAQTSGTEVAKQIGDVLSGDTDFSTFVRKGGEALDIFKKEFADTFKNQQAQAFFNGERVPGAPDLRGGGNITIAENQFANQGGVTRFNANAAITNAQILNQLPTIRNDIQAQIQFTVDVKGLSFREAVKVMKEELSKEILNPQSEISKSLDQHITGEPGTRL